MDRSLKVGIITTLLITAIGVLILWKSDLKFRANGYKLIGSFENVAGLLKGADVRYRGYPVGRVSTIHPYPKHITVEFWVDRDVDIPEGSLAKIQFDGLVGENFLGIQPNEATHIFLKHNDTIQGDTGSDLANFLDLGSKNLVQTEAILTILRNLIGSDQNTTAFNNIISSVDTIATQLNEVVTKINNTNNTDSFTIIMRNMESLTKRLDRVSKAILDDGDFAGKSSKIMSDFADISAGLKSITDGTTPQDIKSMISNLQSLSNRLNQLFPDKKGEGSNVLSTVSSIKVKTLASIRYSSPDKNTYYDANLGFNGGKYFFNMGFGNREGINQFLHFQQGIKFNKYIATRIGLFYQKTGLAFDLYPNARTNLSVEIYESLSERAEDFEVDLVARYKLRKDLDFIMGLRKNQSNRQFNNVDTGMSYHF